ncbi:WbqC family protein [Rhodospirillaceae bacterium KN72]|uniref:WbqC family protein n=1 Tax=Pacificispira spongiicola TaxID=2729598 RepID=A0A7Y0E336_9PROT|nr:WbqC family protein [Pacificispira spongiicola]
MIVGIHQPNYFPWLGYFRKIARSDHFVFLDDTAFSKGSVTNRVKILDGGKESWLTVPAKPSLGTAICDVTTGDEDWPVKHLSRLRNAYRKRPFFKSVWPELEVLFSTLPSANLSAANRAIIEFLCRRLELNTVLHSSASMGVSTDLPADDRLIAIIREIPGGEVYLSGRGGKKYQDEGKFASAGIHLQYNDYQPQPYDQGAGIDGFIPGLSVADALFNVGWQGTATLVREHGVDGA